MCTAAVRDVRDKATRMRMKNENDNENENDKENEEIADIGQRKAADAIPRDIASPHRPQAHASAFTFTFTSESRHSNLKEIRK